VTSHGTNLLLYWYRERRRWWPKQGEAFEQRARLRNGAVCCWSDSVETANSKGIGNLCEYQFRKEHNAGASVMRYQSLFAVYCLCKRNSRSRGSRIRCVQGHHRLSVIPKKFAVQLSQGCIAFRRASGACEMSLLLQIHGIWPLRCAELYDIAHLRRSLGYRFDICMLCVALGNYSVKNNKQRF